MIRIAITTQVDHIWVKIFEHTAVLLTTKDFDMTETKRYSTNSVLGRTLLIVISLISPPAQAHLEQVVFYSFQFL